MAEIPLRLLPHLVTAEPHEGTGAHGEVYGAAVPNLKCFVDEARRMITGSDGTEVVSEATLYTRLANENAFTIKGLVTIPWDGRKREVIAVRRRDDGGLGAWQHLEVALT